MPSNYLIDIFAFKLIIVIFVFLTFNCNLNEENESESKICWKTWMVGANRREAKLTEQRLKRKAAYIKRKNMIAAAKVGNEIASKLPPWEGVNEVY